ncbi:hypothetical protein D3C74_328320 [compost metagenome]
MNSSTVQPGYGLADGVVDRRQGDPISPGLAHGAQHCFSSSEARCFPQSALLYPPASRLPTRDLLPLKVRALERARSTGFPYKETRCAERSEMRESLHHMLLMAYLRLDGEYAAASEWGSEKWSEWMLRPQKMANQPERTGPLRSWCNSWLGCVILLNHGL